MAIIKCVQEGMKMPNSVLVAVNPDTLEPLSINGLTPPGFGGRIYFPTAVGKGFYVLQVMPRQAQAGK